MFFCKLMLIELDVVVISYDCGRLTGNYALDDLRIWISPDFGCKVSTKLGHKSELILNLG